MTRHLRSSLDNSIPGVNEAYARLRSKDGRGLYTSRGSFFNRTIFGRDASMAAKFVADIDHDIAIEVITTLVSLQGTSYNTKTQEEPGRIHHEWRDFRLWRGSLFERLPFWLLRRKWDIGHHQLLTYYALDSTAAFIRLVHKYATHIDTAVLDRVVKDRHGNKVTVGAALELAADWITGKVDSSDLIREYRQNKWSLPVQTFQDSLYSRKNGTMIDIDNPIAYIEVQAFAADALYDMAHLFPRHHKYREWRETGLRMHRAMLVRFQRDDGYYAAAVDSRGQIDVPNISAGWILNTFVWHEMDGKERADHIGPIVERLFSGEFLTTIGLRTRSKDSPNPIEKVLDYHGSETVWPMFNFMVIEGLRRHRLYRLAEELENRVINGLNAIGDFSEYHIVLRDGRVVIPTRQRRRSTLDTQMKPEVSIGFSVVPAMVMVRRRSHRSEKLQQAPWQSELEQKILRTIPHSKRVQPADAVASIGPTVPLRVRRWRAGIRVIRYFRQQRRDASR